ncbi:acyl-CoA dehydrogenase family protein [Sphingomonas crocodyli]|uniref:Acyl-CoA dehydrogenase n=1 Tax=Sphingomonas crocodyli TaxID=1979270 RepID=A0A437M6R5_9SPHN|nr:acyl-CoA dehydrogenase family protein [Sphingomonas crocodyli]RVT93256.1 acyl-CoA dehydrogenase [Sphingomonas crocodyli]
MRFAFTDEQAMIAETANDLFVGEATSERTRAAMADAGCDRALWDSLSATGFVGVHMPGDVGGSELGMVELAIIAEAAGRQVAAVPLIATQAALSALQADGRADLIERVLGGQVATLALAGGLAPHGTIADLFLIEQDGGLVVADRDAVEVGAGVTMDQTRPLAQVKLTGAPIATLSAKALDVAKHTGWIAVAADALGGAQACLDRTVEYVKERQQFGQAIGGFQAIKHRLADMMVEIEQARSAVYWAACAVDEGAEDAELALHSAKAFAADAYATCAGAMIQLHGGIGFTWEHDAHLFFKRAQADRTLFGSSAQHREAIAQIIGLGAIAA